MAESTFGKGHHLHLIDGSAYIFRAYHALPPLTRKSDGLPVGAVAGFCNMLWNELDARTLGRQGRTHLAVVFDHSRHTFRNDALPRLQGQPPRAARGPAPAVPPDPRGHPRLQRRLP